MNLNLLLIITAVILLCMVMDGYKKGMVRSLISLISLLITCVVLFLKMFPILIGKIFASDKVSLLSVFRPKKIMCERQ